MYKHLLYDFFNKSPMAFSLHKVVKNHRTGKKPDELLDANKAFEDLTGIKAASMAGKSSVKLFAEDAKQWESMVAEVLAGQKPVTGEFTCKPVNKILSVTMYAIEKEYIGCCYTSIGSVVADEKPTPMADVSTADSMTEGRPVSTYGESEQFPEDPDIEIEGLTSLEDFDKRVEEEIDRSDRYDEPLSMILMEPDHLGMVEKTWGKGIRQEVMKEIIKICLSCIRKYDIIAKQDDGRFILLLPKSNIKGAMDVVERIRKMVNDSLHPVVGKYSACYGISQRTPKESYEDWFQRLNKALQNAQEKGVDQVVQATVKDRYTLPLAPLIWKKEYNSGNKEIDQQHQGLVNLANGLIQELNMNSSPEEMMVFFQNIIVHLVKHFDSEEKLMAVIQYPDHKIHGKIHKNLIGKAFELMESFENGEINAIAYFSFLAEDVIMEHMLAEDLLFSPYVKNNNSISKGKQDPTINSPR